MNSQELGNGRTTHGLMSHNKARGVQRLYIHGSNCFENFNVILHSKVNTTSSGGHYDYANRLITSDIL